MAFNLSPTTALLAQLKERPFIHHHPFVTCLLPLSTPTKNLQQQQLNSSRFLSSPLTKKPFRVARVNQPPGAHQDQRRDDFYVNLGLAVRTLREDLPLLFTKDLNYNIYR